MSGRRAWVAALLAALAVAAGVVIAVISDSGEPAGATPGVTLADVAGDPGGLAGDLLTVSGTVAPSGFLAPEDAPLAFVLTDGAGHRVLALPRAGTRVGRLRDGARVRVRGTVLDPQDPSPAVASRLEAGGLGAGVGASAAMLVEEVHGGARERGGRPVRIAGTAERIGDAGLLLTADGRSVVVAAPAGALAGIRDGDAVRLRADAESLSPYRAALIGDALAAPGGAEPRELAEPLRAGTRFLLLRGRIEKARGDAARAPERADLHGVVYRVTGFRRLRPQRARDRRIYDGPPPDTGARLYLVAMSACNRAGAPRTPTARIHLEDAFGQTFEPVAQPRSNRFAYRPRRLATGACVPRRGSRAARRLGGAALVFEAPASSTRRQPLRLAIGGGARAVRVPLEP